MQLVIAWIALVLSAATWIGGIWFARNSRTEERLIGLALEARAAIRKAVALEVAQAMATNDTVEQGGVPDPFRSEVTEARHAAMETVVNMHVVSLRYLEGLRRRWRHRSAPNRCKGENNLAREIRTLLLDFEERGLNQSAHDCSWLAVPENLTDYFSRPEVDRLSDDLLYVMERAGVKRIEVTGKDSFLPLGVDPFPYALDNADVGEVV